MAIPMSFLQNHKKHCPYCGERIELIIDHSIEEQSYVEDCSVCCRPIMVQVYCYDGDASVVLATEND